VRSKSRIAQRAVLLAEGSLRELRIVGRGERCMRQQDAEALGAALPRARLQVLELPKRHGFLS
jgi:hypothetical protein